MRLYNAQACAPVGTVGPAGKWPPPKALIPTLPTIPSSPQALRFKSPTRQGRKKLKPSPELSKNATDTTATSETFDGIPGRYTEETFLFDIDVVKSDNRQTTEESFHDEPSSESSTSTLTSRSLDTDDHSRSRLRENKKLRLKQLKRSLAPKGKQPDKDLRETKIPASGRLNSHAVALAEENNPFWLIGTAGSLQDYSPMKRNPSREKAVSGAVPALVMQHNDRKPANKPKAGQDCSTSEDSTNLFETAWEPLEDDDSSWIDFAADTNDSLFATKKIRQDAFQGFPPIEKPTQPPQKASVIANPQAARQSKPSSRHASSRSKERDKSQVDPDLSYVYQVQEKFISSDNISKVKAQRSTNPKDLVLDSLKVKSDTGVPGFQFQGKGRSDGEFLALANAQAMPGDTLDPDRAGDDKMFSRTDQIKHDRFISSTTGTWPLITSQRTGTVIAKVGSTLDAWGFPCLALEKPKRVATPYHRLEHDENKRTSPTSGSPSAQNKIETKTQSPKRRSPMLIGHLLQQKFQKDVVKKKNEPQDQNSPSRKKSTRTSPSKIFYKQRKPAANADSPSRSTSAERRNNVATENQLGDTNGQEPAPVSPGRPVKERSSWGDLAMAAVQSVLRRDGQRQSNRTLAWHPKDEGVPDAQGVREQPVSPTAPVKNLQLPEKYAKMIQIGIPMDAVKNALQRDGLDPNIYYAGNEDLKENQGSQQSNKLSMEKDLFRRFRVHWDTHQNVGTTSIWASVNRKQDWLANIQVDETEEERLFQESKNASRLPAPPKSESDEQQEVQLIDPKRANNGGIILARIKLSYREIARAIESFDDASFTQEQIKGLIQLVPTLEEKKSLQEHISQGVQSFKTECEKFMAELLVVNEPQKKLEAMLFVKKFHFNIQELVSESKLVRIAAAEIMNSNRFRIVLGTILYLGNRINTAGTTGTTTNNGTKAAAIKIESLTKLHQGKAFDKKTSFLQYAARVIRRSFPQVVKNFSEELPTLDSAEKVNWKQSLQELASMESTLTSLRHMAMDLGTKKATSQITTTTRKVKDKSSVDNEVSVLQSTSIGRFTLDACIRLANVYGEVESANQSVQSLFAYFGEEERPDFGPQELFRTLSIFCDQFQTALNQDCCAREKAAATTVRPNKPTTSLTAINSIAVSSSSKMDRMPVAAPPLQQLQDPKDVTSRLAFSDIQNKFATFQIR